MFGSAKRLSAPPVRELSPVHPWNCRGPVVFSRSAERKKASCRAFQPGVTFSLPSPAENPPPMMWAAAHTASLPETNNDIKYCVFGDP